MEADRAVPAPQLGWELRDDAGILVTSGSLSTAELGWDATTRSLPLRFEVDRPPFSEGRLHLRLDLTDAETGTQYHSLDDALAFLIYPAGDERGLVRLEGSWTRAERLAAVEAELR